MKSLSSTWCHLSNVSLCLVHLLRTLHNNQRTHHLKAPLPIPTYSEQFADRLSAFGKRLIAWDDSYGSCETPSGLFLSRNRSHSGAGTKSHSGDWTWGEMRLHSAHSVCGNDRFSGGTITLLLVSYYFHYGGTCNTQRGGNDFVQRAVSHFGVMSGKGFIYTLSFGKKTLLTVL